MRRICLTVLIGLPGAGKTTFSEHLLEAKLNEFNILHFCYDNFFTFNTPTDDYKLMRKNILQNLESVVKSLKFEQNALNSLRDFSKLSLSTSDNNDDYVIICDDNHFYRSMRYKLYQLARHYSLSYRQIYFECDLSKALERNEIRPINSRLPLEIIQEMSKKLEIPKADNTTTYESNTLVLKDSQLKANQSLVLSFLINSFTQPLKPLEKVTAKNPNDQSLVHRLDILMRKRINQLVAEINASDEKRDKAEYLNNQRKDLLNEFVGELNQSSTSFNDLENLLAQYLIKLF